VAKIIKANPTETVEKEIKLAHVGAGNFFRFATTTFEEAMANEDAPGLFMVVTMPAPKTGRVTIVSIDGKSVQEKDDDHLVIVHPVTIQVGEAERA